MYWLKGRDLVQWVKTGVQTRGKGRCRKRVVCFFLCPDADCSRINFTGKKILLAEDVALNLEVAVSLLKMVGIDVICAEDGKQAVDAFINMPEGTFDCILMDVNMPVMDGYEATRLIRSSQKKDAKTIPIYAMTANAFSSDVTDALNAGMNGHIAKPIETDVLYKTLEETWK